MPCLRSSQTRAVPSIWLKTVIIAVGKKLASVEVETVLYRQPAISTDTVLARPHVKWSESPCAVVALRAAARVTKAEVIAFCRNTIAHFMVPKTGAVCTLPKTDTGKIQKFILRAISREIGSLP